MNAVGALRLRAARLAGSEAARGAALSMSLKVGGSALNLVMLTLVARSMGAHEFGILALWFNALGFLAVAAGLGQERLILRSWSEYTARGDWGLARGALLFGLATTLAGSVLAAAAVLGFGALRPPADPWLAPAGALFVVAQTVYFYLIHANRAVIGILRSDMHDMTWRAVVVAVACWALAAHVSLTASGFFLAAASGLGLAIALQLAATRRFLPRPARDAGPRAEPRSWARRSAHMAVGANLEAAAQFLEVIAIGLVLSPAAAGGYFAASRIANAFAMISGGLNSFSTREIPRRHFGSGSAALADALRHLALVTTALVAAGLITVVALGSPVLSLFGEGFSASYPVLVALSVGAAAVALAGPAPALLLLTGHEGAYSRLLALCLALRFLAVIACAWAFGPLGAAIASAGTAAAGAVALNMACRRLVGVDPAATGLLWPRPQP